jgi:hypothetical protein
VADGDLHLPAVEGSAGEWGALLDDRDADLADEEGSAPDRAEDEGTRGSWIAPGYGARIVPISGRALTCG